MNNEIAETLKAANNEGTESPYWLIIDPSMVKGIVKAAAEHNEIPDSERILSAMAFSIGGPFFSREDAENYLRNRRYAYSSEAKVWCSSGYRSRKYKDFYRSLK